MFKVTFVCTGNQCRSPYAAARLGNLAPNWVVVSSAGTIEIEGAPPPLELTQIAGERGVDLNQHTSRSLVNAELSQTDLVLGMGLDHVAAAVVTGGADAERAFSITEFARLLDTDRTTESAGDPEGARGLIQDPHRRRIAERVFVPAGEVEDPMGGPRSGYEEMSNRIDDLCELISARFGWLDPAVK